MLSKHFRNHIPVAQNWCLFSLRKSSSYITFARCGAFGRIAPAICCVCCESLSYTYDRRTPFMLHFACVSELLGSAKKVNVNFQDTDG